MCFDGTKRLCHIRGKLRKKVWINQSDIILIGLRDYQDAKADVIMKYSADEARNLKLYGELPDNAKINDTFAPDDDNEIIMFDDVSTEQEVEQKSTLHLLLRIRGKQVESIKAEGWMLMTFSKLDEHRRQIAFLSLSMYLYRTFPSH